MSRLVVALLGGAAVLATVRAARRADAVSRTRALTPRAGRVLPARLRAPLARALAAADVALTPEDAVRLWAACTAATAVVAWALAPALGVVALLGSAAGIPTALQLAGGRRTARLVAALPGLLDDVAADLRSGGTVRSALERIADGSGLLAPDVAVVRSRTLLGLDLVDALGRWADDRPDPGVAEVTGALAVATTTGGRAATALTGLAASLRDRLAAEADARALSAQARASAVVVGMAPLAYVVFAAVADPGSVGALVGTPVGRACLVVGLTLDAVAALWMRRLVRFAP